MHLRGRSYCHRALKSKKYGRGNKGPAHSWRISVSDPEHRGPCAALGLLVSKCQENIPQGTDPQFCFFSFIPNIFGHWQPQHILDLHLTAAGVLSIFCWPLQILAGISPVWVSGLSCSDFQQDRHSSLDDPGHQTSGHFADLAGISPEKC